MPRIRIFVSFDRDHDADLHDRLREEAQRPGAAFQVSGHSHGGAVTDAWTASARSRIRAADEVLLICGEHSDESLPMAVELRLAQEEERPYLLLWGRREGMCTRPATARASDGMYSWTWEILQSQVRSLVRPAHSVAQLAAHRRVRQAARPGADEDAPKESRR